MLKSIFGTVIALGLAAGTAAAQDSFKVAANLASVLGAERPCGLSFKPEAIETFIAKNVAADDMGFPSTLSTMTGGAEYGFENMSAGAKVAQCAQVKRVAKSYGFID